MTEAIEQTWPYAERLAYQLASRILATESVSRLLISSIARGQAASTFAQQTGEAASETSSPQIDLFDFEHYRFRMFSAAFSAEPLTAGLTTEPPFVASVGKNFRLLCSAEPPCDPRYELVVLCVRRDWGAELTRDLLQSFASCVAEGGNLVVVVDHPNDNWVGDHLRDAVKGSASAAAKNVRRHVEVADDGENGATGYVVQQSSLDVRPRDFRCQFAFRHQGKLLQAVSRPGVFAHRKLDLGARRLIDAMQIDAGQKVLDIGCGSGVVSFATASLSTDILVTAIDSNARAVECTKAGIALNQLDAQIQAYVSSDGSVPGAGEFDIALGNPPYFANFQIAELFLRASHDAVKPGGVIWFVAKQPDWYKLNVPRWFDRVRVTSVGGGYCIATGIRPAESRHDSLV